MWTRPFIHRTLALAALVLAAGSCDQAHRLAGPSGALSAEAPQADSVAPAAETVNAWAFKAGTGAVNATLEGLGYYPYNGGGAAWFQYGTDPALTSPSTTPPDSVASVQWRVVHRAQVGPLVRDSTYYFRLVVRTAQGTRFGAIKQFRAGAPDPASSFAVTLDSLDYTLYLTWTHDGANVRTWTVLRRPAGEAAWAKLTQFLSPDPREFTDSVLNPLMGGAYEYQVLACNASYCGASPVLHQQAPPLPPATGLTATPVGTRIELAWQKGPYGTSPRVYRRHAAAQAFTPLYGHGLYPWSTEFTDHTVTPGHAYVYRVQVCARQACVDSEPASATAGGGPGIAPGPVTGGVAELMKMADGTGRVQATLHGAVVTNGTSALGWMEYGSDPGLAGAVSTPAVPVPASAASVPVTVGVGGLTRDQTYYYRMVAQADSVRYQGAIRSFRAGAPDAPASFTAVFEQASWGVPLTWTHAGGGDLQVFLVERRRAGEAWGQVLRVVPTARKAADAAFSVLAANDFEYRISACNRVACSPPVQAGPVHTPALLPSEVTATQEGTDVRVQWQNRAPAARSIALYRRTSADTVTLFSSANPSVYPLPATGSHMDRQRPAGTYSWFLVLCARGECATSNEATLTLVGGPSAPVAVTGEVGQLQPETSGSAYLKGQLGGTVNPNGAATQARAQFGLSPTLAGASTGIAVSAGAGTEPVDVVLPISGLLRDTVYYYRVHATNWAGASTGEIHSVSTHPPDPVAALTAAFVDARTDYVQLQWSHDRAGTETWWVDRRLPGGAWIKRGQPSALEHQYMDFDAATRHGATIDYRVSACGPIGCSVPVQVSVSVP